MNSRFSLPLEPIVEEYSEKKFLNIFLKRKSDTFKNISLLNVNLEGFDFSKIRFENCCFDTVNFNSVNFSNTIFKDCFFHQCGFKEANFKESEFWRVNFKYCDLDTLDLTGAILYKLNLQIHHNTQFFTKWDI